VAVGIELGVLKEAEISENTFQLYMPPNPEIIQRSGCEMHWFSYYNKWVPEENYYYCVNHTGMEPNPEGRSEGTYTKYVSLDDKMDGFHWYFSYMKFGMGRASRDAQTDIRRHHITRDEGVALTRRYDGEFPKNHFDWMLNYMGVSEEYFWEVCDFYRSKSNVWEKVGGQWNMKYQVS
jgi:hypothetical protein